MRKISTLYMLSLCCFSSFSQCLISRQFVFSLKKNSDIFQQNLIKRHLNRILLEEEELQIESGLCHVILSGTDFRTQHIFKILKAETGQTIRAGVVDAGIEDNAKIEWLGPTSKGKVKLIPNLKIELGSKAILQPVSLQSMPRVSLLLAVPRPLALERILPMISSLGVKHIVLTAAEKVEKDYFGSHLFKPEREKDLRKTLVEGLAQCGDTYVPKVKVVKRLKVFLEDELNDMFPANEYVRVIAHPDRPGQPSLKRMRDVTLMSNVQAKDAKLLLAVGPEGGWAEPYELDLFQSHGFQSVSLGKRILRSDVAVCSLLALAHDWVEQVKFLTAC